MPIEPASLLPPNATTLERAVAGAGARISDIPAPLADLWNPATCPEELLPWLAWGLSIDIWNSDWTEAEKRAAIADAVPFQRRKGTRTSLRLVLDRFDTMIGLVEWFEANPPLDPYLIRLELPLPMDSAVVYDEALVAALLRDIAQVKPLRVHMKAVHKLVAVSAAYLDGGASAMNFVRFEGEADTTIDPIWATYLQTEQGEPILGGAGEFLEDS